MPAENDINLEKRELDLGDITLTHPQKIMHKGQLIGEVRIDKDGLVIDLENTEKFIIKGACNQPSLHIRSKGVVELQSSLELQNFNVRCAEFIANGNVNAQLAMLAVHDSLVVNGTINATTIGCFSSNGIENNGSLYAEQKLKVRSKVFIDRGKCHSNNKISVKSQHFLSENKSEIDSDGTLKIRSEQWQSKGKVVGQKKANIIADKITFQESSSANLTNGVLLSKVVQSDGNSVLNNTIVDCDFYTENGTATANSSRIRARKRYEVKEKAKAIVSKTSLVNSPLVTVKGELKLDTKSVIAAENSLSIDGDLNVNEAAVQAKNVTESPKGKVKLTKSKLCGDKLIFRGESTAAESTLVAQNLTATGQFNGENATLKIDNNIDLKCETNLKNVKVAAKYLDLDGVYSIEESVLDLNELYQNGQGKIHASEVHTGRHDLAKGSDLFLWQSMMQAQDSIIKGDIKGLNAQIRSNNLFQDQGTVDLHQSTVEIANLWMSNSNSKLEGDLVTLRVKDGWLENKTEFKNSDIEVSTLSSQVNWSLENSKLVAKNKIRLEGDTRIAKSSVVAQNQVAVSGTLKSDSSEIVSSHEIVVNPKAEIIAEKSGIKAPVLKDFGEIDVKDNSLIESETVAVYGELAVTQSKVAANELTIKTEGSLSSTEASLNIAELENQGTAKLIGTLVAADNVRLECGSVTDAQNTQIKAKESVTLAIDSEVSGTTLSIKTDTFENNGDIHVTKMLNIDGEKVRNFGTLNGGENARITANRYLINFLGSISASHTNVTAVANLNFLSAMIGNDSLSVQSFLDFNALGLYAGYNVNVSNLIGINAGLIAPTLPDSLDAIFSWQHGINVLRSGLTTFLPQYSNMINVGATVLPLVANKAVRLYDVVKKGGSLKDELLPDLKFFSADARLVDALPLALSVYNTAMMGYGLYKSSSAAMAEFGTLKTDWHNFTQGCTSNDWFENWSLANWGQLQPNFQDSYLRDVAYATALVLGPTQTIQSAFNLNMGVNISNNINQTGLFNFNHGFCFATQAYNRTDYCYGHNSGFIGADRVTMTGVRLDQEGSVFGNSSLFLNYQHIDLKQQGLLYSANATIFADHFKAQGRADFDNLQGRIAELDIMRNAQLNVGGGMLSTNNIRLGGELTANNFYVENKEDITVADSGRLKTNKVYIKTDNFNAAAGSESSFDQSYIKADSGLNFATGSNLNATLSTLDGKNSTYQGNSHFSGSQLTADQLQTAGSFVTRSAEVSSVAEDGTASKTTVGTQVHAQHVTLDGAVDLKGTALKSDNDLTVARSANVKAEQSALEAKNIRVQGDLKTNQASVKAEEHIAVHGQADFEQSHVSANNLTNDGRLKMSQVKAEITHDITNLAEAEVKESLVDANNITNAGKLAVDSSELNAKAKFAQDDQAEGVYKNSHVTSGQRTLLAGMTTAEKSHFESAGTVKHDGLAVLTDVLVTADDIQQNGTVRYSGYLGMQAASRVELGFGSETTVRKEGQPSLLEITAKQASLSQGSVNADNVKVKVDQLPGVNDFIERRNKYSNFIVTESLGLEVDQDINLSRPINRECGLDLTGRSVQVSTDYKTSGTLRFKSTDGDVRLYSNLTGQNVYADSHRDLYTTKNIKATGIVGLKAQGNYDNVAGNISGDVVACEAARIRNLSAEALKYSDQKKAEDEALAKLCKKYGVKYEPQDPLLNDLDASASAARGTGGTILGREVYLTAIKSNIENHGGVIKATEYLQGVAKQDIINRCNVIETKGKHDTIKTFDPAIMSGGAGQNHNGIGLHLEASGTIYNQGSTFISEGSNFLHAKQGVEIITQHYTYVSEHKKHRKWHGTKKVIEKTATNIGTAAIISKTGENIIIVDEGMLYGEAAQFVSEKGTKAYARDDIQLYDVKYEDKTTKKSSSMWGLSSSSKKERHEQAVPTLIYDHGVSILNSKEGNVICQGLVAGGKGDLYIYAPKGDVKISTRVLNHHVHEKHKSFGVSVPLYENLKAATTGNVKDTLNQIDPTFQKINALIDSDSQEFFNNSWNTAVSGYNSYQNLLNAQRNGLFSFATSQLGITPAAASVDFSWSQSDSRTHTQEVGPGGIQRNSLTIVAGNNCEIQGVDIDVAGDLSIAAKQFTYEGHELHTSQKDRHDKITVGVGAGGVNHVSGSHQSSAMHATHHQNAQAHVGGTFRLDVDVANIAAANIDTGDIAGKAGQLNLSSRQDTMHAKQQSVAFDSNGAGSYSESKSSYAQIGQATDIHVRNGINQDEPRKFHVDKTTLVSAKITSDGVNNYSSDAIEAKELKDVHKERSFGISGNVNDVADAIAPARNGNQNQSDPLATVNVMKAKADKIAVQRATIYGEQGTALGAVNVSGNLNTQNSNGYEVEKEKHRTLNLDLPVAGATVLLDKLRPVNLPPVEQPQQAIKAEDPAPVLDAQGSVAAVIPQAEAEPISDKIGAEVQQDLSSASVAAHSIGAPSVEAAMPEVSPAVNNSTPSAHSEAHRHRIQDIAIESGFKVLEIAYEEAAVMIEHAGAPGVAKIFEGLGQGLNFAQNYNYAKENGSQTPAIDALIYTAIAVPNSFMRWFVKIPMDIAASATEPFTDRIEENNYNDFSSELVKKYGYPKDIETIIKLGLDPEDFERTTIIEAYGAAKALQFFSGYDKILGDEVIRWKNGTDSASKNPNSFFHGTPADNKSAGADSTLQPTVN